MAGTRLAGAYVDVYTGPDVSNILAQILEWLENLQGGATIFSITFSSPAEGDNMEGYVAWEV